MKRLTILLLSLAVLGTACSLDNNVFSLGVGDCFNEPDAAQEVTNVEMVDCSQPHDNEVYATYDIPGSSFPGQAAVEENAVDGCLSRFEPFVGADYYDSSLDVRFLTPTAESWDQADDREVVCFLHDLNGAKLSTSVRGTGI